MRSTLAETGNLRRELMLGEECWVRRCLGLVQQKRAVRIALTATCVDKRRRTEV